MSGDTLTKGSMWKSEYVFSLVFWPKPEIQETQAHTWEASGRGIGLMPTSQPTTTILGLGAFCPGPLGTTECLQL